MADENGMQPVVARKTIHRRVGDKFETIQPRTQFVPQHEDELNELKASEAVFDSPKDQEDFEKAAEGLIVRKPGGVTTRDVPLPALRAEAVHNADIAAGLAPTTVVDEETGETSTELPAAKTTLAARRAARANQNLA